MLLKVDNSLESKVEVTSLRYRLSNEENEENIERFFYRQFTSIAAGWVSIGRRFTELAFELKQYSYHRKITKPHNASWAMKVRNILQVLRTMNYVKTVK